MTFRFPAKPNHHPAGAMEGGGSTRQPAPAPARMSSVFRRLLVRVTPAERLAAADGGVVRDNKNDERPPNVGGGGDKDAEVGSVALDRMVLSFMEDAAVEPRPPRGRCSNCFNGHQDASDDDEEFDFLPSSSSSSAPAAGSDALELLKGLVQCASAAERTLLADASRIAERCRKQRGGGGRNKKAEVRRAVAAGLRSLGYDAAVCRSRWDKSPSHPAGEHEYIDALVVPVAAVDPTAAANHQQQPTTVRLVVEVDFRSEFEVARPTKAYRAALQALPPVFVGPPERVGRVVAVVAEAARQSLRKRGLHFPPWRKPEYMRAKWMAPHTRDDEVEEGKTSPPAMMPATAPVVASAAILSGEFELRFDDKIVVAKAAGEEEKITVVVSPDEEARKQSPQANTKGKVQVAGLASVL